jgi:hypothetical protein
LEKKLSLTSAKMYAGKRKIKLKTEKRDMGAMIKAQTI